MTLAHILLVEWRDGLPAGLPAIVDAFAGEIPGVLSVAHGASVSPEHLEAGFEWALVVTFADEAARDGYLVHAAHAPASALIAEWNTRLVVFDVSY